MKNGTCLQFFDWYCAADGEHWNRLEKELPALLEMGITALWLPPAFKGTKGAASEGYDVYDLYDLGEFDQKGSVRTKYGTKEQYIAAVQKARDTGMAVYIDVVMNHMGGAEETERITVRKVNPDNRNEFISDPYEIEAYTKFTFPGRGDRYSNFKWDHQCFTGIDFAADTKETAIFSIQNEYGEGWEPLSHEEKGNFDYLILNDIETRNPAVREELKRWIKWYYDTLPFDGIRLDAVKHINPDFLNEWTSFVKQALNPEMFMLAEFWLSDDLDVLLHFIEATNRQLHVFDAPLHHNFSIASNAGTAYDLRKILDVTVINAQPGLAMTFVDNHDTQPLQSLEEYTEQWFKPHAYAIILLRKDGYPCVFYPDLYGTCYKGKNKEGQEQEIDIQPLPELPLLIKTRSRYSYGEQLDYFQSENSIGWFRLGDEAHPGSGCAVVLNTHEKETSTIHMQPGKEFAGRLFRNILHDDLTVTIDDEGIGLFSCSPRTISVWVPV